MEIKFYKRNSILFYILTILLSWIPWLTVWFWGRGIEATAGKVLLYLGGIGPALAVVGVIFYQRSTAMGKDVLKRLTTFTLISKQGILLIIVIPVLVTFFSVMLSNGLHGFWSQPSLEPAVKNNFLNIFPFILFTLIMGPIPEEIGWRGFWLGLLHKYNNGLLTSLFIAAGWALWHLPLFFIPGYPLAELSSNIPKLIVYFLYFLPISIIHTYLFYLNRKSIIAAILFHFMINFVGTIIEIDFQAEIIQLIIYSLIAFSMIFANKIIFLKRHRIKYSERVFKFEKI